MSVTFFAMYIDMVFQRNYIRLNSSFWFYHNLYRIKWLYFYFIYLGVLICISQVISED